MKPRTVKKGELLMVRGSRDQGLTARGRVMRSPWEQEVLFKHPNNFKNILLEHISGPMKGTTILFKHILCRKAKIQSVCLCDAYTYPHATGRGKCEQA